MYPIKKTQHGHYVPSSLYPPIPPRPFHQKRRRPAPKLPKLYAELHHAYELPDSLKSILTMSPPSPQNSLKGKLVLITGASGGIGRAIAQQLVLHDVDLALHYSSNALAVEELVAQLRHDYETLRPGSDRYLRITTHQANMEKTDEVIAMVEEIREKQGRGVDVLVSNAGYGKRITDVWDIPLEEFQKTLTINLTASFLLVKGCVEHMKQKKWGRIIFVSSIAASGVGINGCRMSLLPIQLSSWPFR